VTTVISSKPQKNSAKNLASVSLPSWFEHKLGNWLANKLTKFMEFLIPANARLLDMVSSFQQGQCLYVVAKLKVADCLVDSPKHIQTLAEELKVQADPLARIMRYLCELGIFGQDHLGRYTLTKVSELLVSYHPQSLRPVVLLYNEETYTAWANLLHTVKTGENTFSATYNTPFFKYHSIYSDFADIYNQSMASLSILLDQAVAEDYDFSVYRTLADVGGGQGNLLRRIAERYSSLQCILFDTQAVLTVEVKEQWEQDPLANRVKLQIGDFFQSVPTDVDAYLLKNVIHNWPDEQVIQIYKTIHQAMKPQSRLLLAETVIFDNDAMQRMKLNLDLNMMVIHSSKERTVKQHSELLETAGLKIVKIVPTRSHLSVIEAKPMNSY
jgi:hypothetical protein